MIDSMMLLDDVAFAKALLEKKTLSNADLVFALRNLLRMKYYPVAVKYFYDQGELGDFKKRKEHKVSSHPFTFCHYLAASRQRGDVLLGTAKDLGCTNAQFVWGWKEFDEGEVKSHLKYAKDMAQAERIVRAKKRLEKGLLAFVTAPLHKASFKPDVIHGMSDVLQAYHLGNDWSAAHDIFPFEMTMTMNSSACHGVAAVFLTKKPNITPIAAEAIRRERPSKARSTGSGRATSSNQRSAGCSSARFVTAACPTPGPARPIPGSTCASSARSWSGTNPSRSDQPPRSQGTKGAPNGAPFLRFSIPSHPDQSFASNRWPRIRRGPIVSYVHSALKAGSRRGCCNRRSTAESLPAS